MKILRNLTNSPCPPLKLRGGLLWRRPPLKLRGGWGSYSSLAVACLFLLTAQMAWAKTVPPPDCNFTPDQPITLPAPVDLKLLLSDLSKLTTNKGEFVVDPEAMREELKTVFDPRTPNSKLQQFYRLLYLIAHHSKVDLQSGVTLATPTARTVLLTAKVFPNSEFPNHIVAIQLEQKKNDDPFYHVTFDDNKATHLPLNRGEGFKSWEDKYCQHAKALVFYGDFSFYLQKLGNGNLLAYDYRNVDLFGDFGTRGMVAVNLNYIQLDSVEFYQQSPFGKVKAYISRKEFDANSHSWLLKAVSRIFPNVSVTALDW